jgi:hypothetical protein
MIMDTSHPESTFQKYTGGLNSGSGGASSLIVQEYSSHPSGKSVKSRRKKSNDAVISKPALETKSRNKNSIYKTSYAAAAAVAAV